MSGRKREDGKGATGCPSVHTAGGDEVPRDGTDLPPFRDPSVVWRRGTLESGKRFCR